MHASECPNRDRLAAYLLGGLDEVDLKALEEHFEKCGRCQAALDELEPACNNLMAELFGPEPDASHIDEPECLEAMSRVEEIVRATPAPDHPPGFALAGLEEGCVLGQYRLVEAVSQGGMGIVFKAIHTQLRRIVAVKVLSVRHTADSRRLLRFRREMEAIGKLEHPNIVQAFDAGEAEGVLYLAMEYVDGMDLGHVVERRGPLPIADACESIRQAALGLQHAHEHGLVHRDVKPSNLMLNRTGQVKLLDLGVALLPDYGDGRKSITGSIDLVGTYDYVSPEQCCNSHDVDIRSDIYGLGCTLYELLCGSPPFSGEKYVSGPAKVRGHMEDAVPPIEERRPEVPRALARLVNRLLAKAPNARPSTPAKVAEEIQPGARGADLAKLLADAEFVPKAVPEDFAAVKDRDLTQPPAERQGDPADAVQPTSSVQTPLPGQAASPSEEELKQEESEPLAPGHLRQPTDLQPAEVFRELGLVDYELVEQIALSRNGILIKAHHITMGRMAAIKVLSPDACQSADAMSRFHRKIMALARSSHPNLVSVYDAGRRGPWHFMVMEYVDGEDLRSLLKRSGPLDVEPALDYLVQAANGLGHVHGHGIVHRNVKPSNLLLDTGGTVKVIGFGKLRCETDEPTDCGPSIEKLTRSGRILGTLDYMAPEQARDSRRADARSDIYSLGCVLYTLLTGSHPFPAPSEVQQVAAHRDNPIPSLHKQPKDVPENVERTFQQMLAKQPDGRPQTMADVVRLLTTG